MRSSSQDSNMSTNNKLFQQMFMQFPQTQANAPAPQAPNIKSECISNPEVFTREGLSIEQIYKHLETFGISLSLKITLNLDHMPTPEAGIAYTFLRIFEIAQNYVALKIQAKYYLD